MNDDFNSIKIRKSVKKRLDLYKRQSTYSDCVDQMLGYFELTGVEPKLGQVPPIATFQKSLNEGNAVLYKRIEDVIKILRSIETNKIDPILHGIDIRAKEDLNNSADEVLTPKDEDIYQLIKMTEKLQNDIIDKDRTINQLKSKFALASQNSKCQEVVDTIKELLSDDSLPRDKNGNYLLTLEYKSQVIKKIETIANV